MGGLGLWDSDEPRAGRRGTYVAISGNTAAGKSSLVTLLEARLAALGHAAIGISERAFHHPLLRLMFAEPEEYAFAIQLSFVLERHLALRHNLLSLGRVVVMERSHLDDILFVEEHVDAGAVTPAQKAAYDHLAETLHARVGMPDVLVLMNPPPEVSLARLGLAEARGERPREFPSEGAKEAWVRRWHERYVGLHDSFRARARDDPAFAATKLVEADARGSLEETAEAVLTALEPRLRSGP